MLDTTPNLPSPWREFLTGLDELATEPVRLHCIGGFVVTYFYGMPRPTGDIDYYTTIPRLDRYTVGKRSPLWKKHGVCLHEAAHATMPVNYKARLTEILPNQFKNLRLFAPHPYDLILSKLESNKDKDRDDAAFLFQKEKLDTGILYDRYEKELSAQMKEFYAQIMRPESEEANLRNNLLTWIAIFQVEAKK